MLTDLKMEVNTEINQGFMGIKQDFQYQNVAQNQEQMKGTPKILLSKANVFFSQWTKDFQLNSSSCRVIPNKSLIKFIAQPIYFV